MQVLIKHTQRINSSAKVNGGETLLAFVQHTEWAAQRNGLLDGNIVDKVRTHKKSYRKCTQ
jgi:hypothetical protein